MSNNFTKIGYGLGLLGLAEDPVSAVAGELYYNTVSNKYRFYNGTVWADIGSGGGNQTYVQELINNQSTPAAVANALFDHEEELAVVINYWISRAAWTSSGTATDYMTNVGTGANNQVYAVRSLPDGSLIVGGGFTQWNGNSRNRLIKLNPDGTENTGFYSNIGTGAGGTVWSIDITPSGKILVAGQFTSFNGNTRKGIVCLDEDGVEDTVWYASYDPHAPTSITTIDSIKISPDGSKIAIGGNFTGAGSGNNCVYIFSSDGSALPPATNLTANNRVYSIAWLNDYEVIVGGNFTEVGSSPVTVGRLCKFSVDGTLDTTFNTNIGTGSGGVVRSIVIDKDGLIYVGGHYTTFNGAARSRLVRMLSNGTLDSGYLANLKVFGNSVYFINLVVGNKLLIGGVFDSYDGNTRNKILMLNYDGTEFSQFYTDVSPGVDTGQGIHVIDIYASKYMFIGGDFSSPFSNFWTIGVNIAEYIEFGSFWAAYSPQNEEWSLSNAEYSGSDAGVTFSISPSGQLNYTTTDISELPSILRYKLNKV